MILCWVSINSEAQSGQNYFEKGNAWREFRDYKGAIEQYTKAIALNPNYYQAFLNRAFVMQILGNYEAAHKDFNRAIQIKPNAYEGY